MLNKKTNLEAKQDVLKMFIMLNICHYHSYSQIRKHSFKVMGILPVTFNQMIIVTLKSHGLESNPPSLNPHHTAS